jgi:hypothetical protein
MKLRRSASIAASAIALAIFGWAGFAPVASPTNEELFEIPKGTWARRMAGDKVTILPEQLRLTLGLRDVLLLRNHDDVPQVFGPTLMMPGQSFRLPFAVASEYHFECTAHPSGQMVILVDPYPANPWARIVWRARELARAALGAPAAEETVS